MQNFKETLVIPSSETILEATQLIYNGQPEEGNPTATFGFSVPLVLDECPTELKYFPLSKSSYNALKENLNEPEFLASLEHKKFCVIICDAFEQTNDEAGQTYKLNPYGSPAYIAGVWDETEDPLMATTLYSCTFITTATEDGPLERTPLFIRHEQISLWLSSNYSLFQKLEKVLNDN